jgi:Tfp pilus assembly protein PilO
MADTSASLSPAGLSTANLSNIVSWLCYALAVIGGGYLIHWHSERRYHAGRADQERSLKSQYKAEFAAISAARAK